jgi:hypothetical protein
MSLTDVQRVELQTQILVGMGRLARAINHLEKWLVLNKADAAYDDLEDRRILLEGDFHLVRARLAEIKRAEGQFAPPDETRMATIRALSDEVAELIRAQATADVMLSMVVKALAIVAEVRKVGASATV